jgi:hypothetical protein
VILNLNFSHAHRIAPTHHFFESWTGFTTRHHKRILATNNKKRASACCSQLCFIRPSLSDTKATHCSISEKSEGRDNVQSDHEEEKAFLLLK